jgi:glyoxylase-like metal-dependent hydrolase (beta-lactamase superfamily II)
MTRVDLEHFGRYPIFLKNKIADTCFISEPPKLEDYIAKSGYEIKNIKLLILTHVHPDHTKLKMR